MRLNILWSKIKFSTFYEGIKDDTRRTNIEALETLKANGITVIPADPAANAVLAEFRDQAVAESVGNYFSAEIYNEMMVILNNYRKSHF